MVPEGGSWFSLIPKPSVFLNFFVCSLIQLNYWILKFTFTKMRFSGFYSVSAVIWLFKIAIPPHCSALENSGPSSLSLLLSSFLSPSSLLSSFLPSSFLPSFLFSSLLPSSFSPPFLSVFYLPALLEKDENIPSSCANS